MIGSMAMAHTTTMTREMSTRDILWRGPRRVGASIRILTGTTMKGISSKGKDQARGVFSIWMGLF